MEYDAIVIGAGVGGLASALKLSLSGKKVLLIEKQPIPGGVATSFKRRGFIFESSLHCVDSLGPEGELRSLLEEFGIDKKVNFIELKEFARIIYPEHDFVLDFNHENFIRFLKDSFPGESKNISRLFGEIDKFYVQFGKFCSQEFPPWLKTIASFLFFLSILKISNLTAEQFITRFIKDVKLKALILDIWRFAGLPPSRLSALYFLLVFEGYYYHPTAYPKGGFMQLFGAIVDRIEEAGSEVKFNTTIQKIFFDAEKNLKITVSDKGEEFKAKVIISNANAIDTLTELLDNDYLKQKYRNYLFSLEKSISAFQVYLGLKIPAKDLGMRCPILVVNTTYNHNDNFNYYIHGDYDRCALSLVDHAQIDPALVPEGKGSLLIIVFDVYANWQNLKDEEYKNKKMNLANKLVSRAEKFLPGLSQYVEVMEVATPKTISRFGSSPKGAIYGFAQTVNQSGINRLSQETAIKGLFLTGAWTRPGAGVHGCFISGMDAADLALKFLSKLR